MTYNFELTTGAPLVTVEPLESNGLGAQSVPRAILDLDFENNAFVVADDLTGRFVAGFSFEVISGPYEGTYTVDVGGSSYDGVTGTTSVPVTTPIVAQPFSIIGVEPTPDNVWVIEGAINGDCVYYPGSTFTVAGNTDGPSNGVYTVVSASVSGTYPLTAVTPGPGGAGTSWTVTGDVGEFFVPGKEFRITGMTPGAGTYTVVSAVLVGLNTEVTVVEAIPGTATITGQATPVPAVTRITTVEAIPGTAAANGTATSPTPVAYTFAAAPTMLTNIAPNTYTIIWHIDDVGLVFNPRFVVGCSVIIKDNDVFDNTTMTIIDVDDDGANITHLTVQFRYPTAPTAPDGTGSLTFPLPPIPFDFIQYGLNIADTSLRLIGRGATHFNNAITWGQALQDNTIHLLENFNDTTPPVSPLQGQLWFNQGSSSLFLFTSTIYDIFDVVPGTDLWVLDGSHGDVTALFTAGLKFAVFNNYGVNLANVDVPGTYPSTMVFEVLSSFFNGTETEITISTTPDVSPPFTIVQTAIPVEADDATPYGKLYLMTEWHELAFSDDIKALDVKASVRLATVAPLPAYTAVGSGFGKTLTEDPIVGALSVDGTLAVEGDRILVKDEAVSDPDHGIYVLTQQGDGIVPWILTRATDADGTPDGEVSANTFLWVEEGATIADTGWVLVTNNPIEIDTTPLEFSKFAVTPVAAGADTQVQFNDGGAFGADADFTWDQTLNELHIVGSVEADEFRMDDTDSAFYLAMQSTSTLTVNRMLTWDVNDADRSLTLSGNLSLGGDFTTATAMSFDDTGVATNNILFYNGTTWVDGTGADITAPGLDTQIIYNDGGLFGADADFTWNDTTHILQLGTVATPATVRAPDGTASAGANLTVLAGAGVGTNQAGGILSLTAGAATGTGTGGNVNITAGASPSGTDGSLVFTTDATERLEIRGDGGWELAGDQGTLNQVLSSNGPGTPPTWEDVGAAASAGALLTTMTNGNGGAITIGQPVYVSAADTVDLGDASATATATPTIGLVFDTSIASAASGNIITHGRITNADWTTATGGVTLTAGATYYLSETTGQITATAPVTVGSWVVPVGIALSTTDLLVNVGLPIQN
jgi:hypothetical protein